MFTLISSKDLVSSCSQSTTFISSNSSDSQNDDIYEYQEIFHGFLQDQREEHISYEIDVKPKKKVFSSKQEKRQFVEDYKKKMKTELCKNWELKGFCKYGDKCSFAHGLHELKLKQHLHSNYKTKPCKQYFYNGFCPYGYRCQYMHNEIKQNVEKCLEFKEFLMKAYKEKQVLINFIARKELSFNLKLMKFENFLQINEKPELLPSLVGKRLPVFKKMCGCLTAN